MDYEKTAQFVDGLWEPWFVQGLSDFIDTPNLTPMVDAEYLKNGKMELAMDLVDNYINKLNLRGMSKKIYKNDKGMPLVVYIIEPEGGCTQNVLMYGHLDKQPYGDGWWADTPPDKATRKGDLLYGRGGADDGYAPFACALAIKNAQEQGVRLPRITIVLENEEESGSPNLLQLLDIAKESIGKPDVLLCMDSGAFDYETLWITSSLRGIAIADVTIQCGEGGYHSGETGGIVPETFRILRTLLDRLDCKDTGKVCDELHMPAPEWKINEAKHLAQIAGSTMYEKYKLVEGAKWCSMDNLEQLYLQSTWEPNMSITGMSDIPAISMAGNAVRPKTSARISMRLPPSMNHHKAKEIIRQKLTENVPYNAKVTINGDHAGSGFCMKDLPDWLMGQMQASS